MRLTWRRSARARAGFTLAELLVVVAILGVLSALLLGAASRSKQAAHRARCVSNLRQIGVATLLYWADNGGACFRYVFGQTNFGQIYWFGWMGPGPEGTRAFDPAQGALYRYLLGRGVEVCPALNYALAQFKLKASAPAYGYGYNLCLSAPPSRPPFNSANIRRPAATGLYADAAQINTFQPPASPQNPMLEEFYYVSTNVTEATAHFRHRRRANVVFADVHVGAEEPAPDSIDARLPGQILGRLRPEVLVP
ncbi:MAG: prepilin-type N-terminal cleavage/methylation domain-containing protein [Verrucomicrobiae bacterium]|nr:prepilin-type N-terminal cleavage/methylation domain-containing protein [Verrucomicrobiae bacterium]MCX7722624.1 prepilin-type N-terminal cleavage/methylation domain-containing protein [Verrucomicrobiae bacterium]MDW7980070.1 type II secretion system protein [Verrucomicrobiales bacterium]